MHVIAGLDVGGAEIMLERLVEAQHSSGDYRETVVSLKDAGEVGQRLRDAGIEVHALELHSPMALPRAIWRLVRLIRASRPDVVQTWMYHANLIGGLAARLAGSGHVIWCIHCTAIPNRGRSVTGMIVWACSWLSRFLPQVIVCCAESARTVHAEKGYDARKMVVISNGYDLRVFDRTPALRQQARAAFGFTDNDVVIGTVGRFDLLKDYKNFVLCASKLTLKVDGVKFLMVGRGLDRGNAALCGWLAESGLAHRFVLAGERDDVPACLAAMDVFCLSSVAEGFPNVVCEAMAMKVPCVVTDAGDAARIVGGTGIVVVPGDPSALAEGLRTMLSKGPGELSILGDSGRLRIERNYSIGVVSAQFEDIYNQLAPKSAGVSSQVAATD